MVVEYEAILEGFGQAVQHLSAHFYADKILLASTQAVRLQRSFDVLADIFDQVGLQTNIGKTAGMFCQPCCAIRGHSVEAYGYHMMG